jgi:hypothetical protein
MRFIKSRPGVEDGDTALHPAAFAGHDAGHGGARHAGLGEQREVLDRVLA